MLSIIPSADTFLIDFTDVFCNARQLVYSHMRLKKWGTKLEFAAQHDFNATYNHIKCLALPSGFFSN